MNARTKSVAWLVAVFLLGGAAGAGFGRAGALRELEGALRGPPTEARARFRIEAMRRHLDLDEGQSARLAAIFAEAEAERERLMETCRPGLDELREKTEARVKGELTPDQAARYEEVGPGRPRGRRGGPDGPGRPGGPPPRP